VRVARAADDNESVRDVDPVAPAAAAVLCEARPVGTTGRDVIGHVAHPIPACRMVAVTLPLALDSAFMVSLTAATGVMNER
jgi:hypothetical protein